MKDNEEVGQSELLEAPEGAQPPTGSGRLERSASQHFTDLITTLGSTAPPTAKQGRLLGLMVVVIHSQPQDWEVLPSDQWLAVSHRSVLGLQLTVVVSASQAQAQLSLACNEQLLGTEAGIAVGDGSVVLPLSHDGMVTWLQESIWRLMHRIKGVGLRYDSWFDQSGLTVQGF